MIVDSSLDYTIPVVDTFRIKYHDNKGNISCITSSRSKASIKFHYNSSNELQRIDYYNYGYLIITNKNGKLDKCSFYSSIIPSANNFDLIFNSSDSDTLTVLERFYFSGLEYKTRYFLYEDVSLPKALTSTYSNDKPYADRYSLLSNSKNNWAKDINNKELLFYLDISELKVFPTQNNFSAVTRNYLLTQYDYDYTDFQYNNANYPVFFNRLEVERSDMYDLTYRNQYKIFYQKVSE